VLKALKTTPLGCSSAPVQQISACLEREYEGDE
jgi:hypothetical protein